MNVTFLNNFFQVIDLVQSAGPVSPSVLSPFLGLAAQSDADRLVAAVLKPAPAATNMLLNTGEWVPALDDSADGTVRYSFAATLGTLGQLRGLLAFARRSDSGTVASGTVTIHQNTANGIELGKFKVNAATGSTAIVSGLVFKQYVDGEHADNSGPIATSTLSVDLNVVNPHIEVVLVAFGKSIA